MSAAFLGRTNALPGRYRELPRAQKQVRNFDSGFENCVASLKAADSKSGTSVAGFDIFDSADDAVAAARAAATTETTIRTRLCRIAGSSGRAATAFSTICQRGRRSGNQDHGRPPETVTAARPSLTSAEDANSATRQCDNVNCAGRLHAHPDAPPNGEADASLPSS